jgi:hypothetical protein
MAIYTLNLILLRTLVGGGSYTLDAHAIDAGHRPWDRLTNLWRSWFETDPWPGSVANGTYAVGDSNGPAPVHDASNGVREHVDVGASRPADSAGEEPDLLLRVYVPAERLYAAETGRLLALFRDWLAGVRRKGVRQSGYHTSSGEMFELFADASLPQAALPAEFDTFERFLGRCADSPATVAGMLTQAGVAEYEAVELVTRYGKEYRRLRVDMRHERERRMMALRHTVEGMLVDYSIDLRATSDIQLDSLLEGLLPAPSTPSSLPAIAAPPVLHLAPNSSVNISQHFITATESTVVHSVQGTLHLGPKVNEVLALLDRVGGDDAVALKTAVHELEDSQAPLASRKASHKKLKDFLVNLAGKLEDAGLQFLEKYLESKGF